MPAECEIMLEARLLAPCCYLQTLDVHESPLATELRSEIHQRIAHGERTSTIETDLVARYGEHVRAMPPGRDTRDIAYPVAAVVLLAIIAVAVALRRWLRGRAFACIEDPAVVVARRVARRLRRPHRRRARESRRLIAPPPTSANADRLAAQAIDIA